MVQREKRRAPTRGLTCIITGGENMAVGTKLPFPHRPMSQLLTGEVPEGGPGAPRSDVGPLSAWLPPGRGAPNAHSVQSLEASAGVGVGGLWFGPLRKWLRRKKARA